ncbi:hypothetical protein KAU11_07320 [Candidatus Babeliales bacterium]|nr:hypothetical protein [Candidatus Babeliales bacterium]
MNKQIQVINKQILRINGRDFAIPKEAVGFFVNGNSPCWKWFDSLTSLRVKENGRMIRVPPSVFHMHKSFAWESYDHPVGYKSITLLSDLKQIKEVVERIHRPGDQCMLGRRPGRQYELKITTTFRARLVTQDGHRWTDGCNVRDPENITQLEMDTILSTAKRDVTWLD